jgi:SAM-dependent methyltransferase
MSDRLQVLTELVACPACRSSDMRWTEHSITCSSCGSTYAVANGTPLLLFDERPPVRGDSDDLGLMRYVPTGLQMLAEKSRSLVRPSLVHRSVQERSRIQSYVTEHSSDARILNVGAGSSDYGANVINLDIAPEPGIDLVGVAEHLPFRDGVFDAILFQAVLEHVSNSERALSEILRVLAPGGGVFIEVPFIQGYHPVPRDHRRFTEQGLRAELEQRGFVVDETGVAVGPASAMAWIAAEFLALLLSGRSGRLYRFARLGTTWLAWPIKWADTWLEAHEMAHVIASGVWARVHKPHDGEGAAGGSA